MASNVDSQARSSRLHSGQLSFVGHDVAPFLDGKNSKTPRLCLGSSMAAIVRQIGK